ncbi:PQQ-binding-like beta-propeller repeat protein [Halorubellus sp. JP-L1]|uniref:outer membrane protein assembly factor BamB family protein n=1 Tax=Halorubellus sp. JP-L1 TaxID=2715753 RepID=UPI00140DB232|nr:PQQ-binding-like beta-propeller repeat protein [Halorubellus sp. JP-L1]NHN43125.1 PQQ-binding-like beta-propeller repeat protein [Halorubellus sp. JP-L1]
MSSDHGQEDAGGARESTVESDGGASRGTLDRSKVVTMDGADARSGLGRRTVLSATAGAAVAFGVGATVSSAAADASESSPGVGRERAGESTAANATPTAANATPTEWVMDGFDVANTRYAPDASAVTGSASEVWEFDVSVDHVRGGKYKTGRIEYAPPTIADGVVIFGDGAVTSSQNYVHAVDVETGEHVWRTTMPEVNASVAVGDGRVYAAGNESFVVGLDLESGQELWKWGVGRDVKSSPKYHDGTVFVGCNDGRFYALDPAEGFRVWRHDTSDDAENLRIYGSQPIDDGLVYVNTWAPGDQASFLYALDVENGRERWKYDVSLGGGKGVAPPAVADDHLLVPDGTRGRMLAFDLDGHDMVWQKEGFEFGPRNGVAIADCRAFVGSLGGHVTAMDVETGEWGWRADTRAAVEMPPTVANGTVYVVDREGWLYGFAVRGGAKRFEYRVGERASTTPRVVDGDLFLASNERLLRVTGDRGDFSIEAVCAPTASTTASPTTDASTTEPRATATSPSTETASETTDPTGDGGTGTDGSGSTPGFGVVASATALASAAGVALRRRRRTTTDEE